MTTRGFARAIGSWLRNERWAFLFTLIGVVGFIFTITPFTGANVFLNGWFTGMVVVGGWLLIQRSISRRQQRKLKEYFDRYDT